MGMRTGTRKFTRGAARRSGRFSLRHSLRHSLRRVGAALSVAALTAGLAVLTPPVAAAAPGDVEIQILGINDFHGRIASDSYNPVAGAAAIAAGVAELRAANPNTVFAAAGDLIGASTFESFVDGDVPTIEALNAAGLEVSAVGNHEFDKGYHDLIDRVVPLADWEYLSANVVPKAGSGWTPLEKSWTKTVAGVEIGFIGAVTEHLSGLVSPDGIAELEINDIAAAVNAEANALKAAGSDIVVLLVHEGYPHSECDDVIDTPNDFSTVVNALNANIDAVISGHTHLAYNCQVPVAEWAAQGRAVTKRPVVSAGQYGSHLDQLLFTVNTAGTVTKIVSKTLALSEQDSAGSWSPVYPDDPAVAKIVDDALANAEVLGARELGTLAGPFNRAKLADGTENRGGESNLGNLVAEAQRWMMEDPKLGGAQIAFMNPGGLRADMTGLAENGYPAALTYQQAAIVQPFANMLVNRDYTGAQIKQILEEQWQPDGASRPMLRLGLSKGFTYTYDPSAARGHHVTGMWLDGTKINLAKKYSVTVNSFLAAGGDQFFTLAEGTGEMQSGETDLEGMVAYMAAKAGDAALAVDQSQRSVGVTFPARAPYLYGPGDTVRFTLSSLVFPAPDGSAAVGDKNVQIKLGDSTLGTFPVRGLTSDAPFDETGTAAVSVRLPATVPTGAALRVVGADTGTDVTLPVPLSTKKVVAPYPDVPLDHTHVANIVWLKAQGITKPADGKYHPDADVTRGQMAAFLYRLANPGKAQPACTAKPFDDVATGHRFCGYISWVKDQRIAFGYADGTYGPERDVTRGAMSAYLYRVVHAGTPAPACTAAPYRDVATGSMFCATVAWAKANRITFGVGDGSSYGVGQDVTRGSMASFLHRIDRYMG